ncbi:uncharacterized protein FTOL_13953 [Fusarium torulosum]|uniref:Uncharacterized protein n=1 Tax=Fusarium torulosum TaxID=33205 RepID=A0AAE8SQB6_9HYPO|nr:uncharacterized protein FTOL_13953 [Fusarium torulosum]
MKGVGYLWDEAQAAKPSRHREDLDRGPMMALSGPRQDYDAVVESHDIPCVTAMEILRSLTHIDEFVSLLL